MAIKLVKVSAVKDLPFSPDGTSVVEYKAGDVFLCPEDTAIGLKASGLVEDAAEDADTAPAPQIAADKAVVSPSVEGMAEVQEIEPEVQAELAAARTVKAPVAAKPDIEPIEHGGDSIDRVLTRGADADAVAVEDADAAAKLGKAGAAAQVQTEIDTPEAKQIAEQQAEQKAKLDEYEQKMAETAPENKAAAKASRGRKS